MGWLSDKLFGKKKTIDLNKIKEYMQPTQNLINQHSGFMGEGMGQAHEMFGLGREFMDPNSQRNVGQRGIMQTIAQRQAADQGAQVGNQMMKMGAMSGVSPGQAMMQARMGQNQAMGGIGQGLLQASLQQMQGATQQGIGLMGQGAGQLRGMGGLQQGLMGMQQGMDENMANAYMGKINAHNARRSQNMGMAMDFATSFIPKPAEATSLKTL